MELKNYLKKIGLKEVKNLADKIGVHHLYLYHIASGFRNPSPYTAMKIQFQTDGEVKVEEILKNEKLTECKKIIGAL